MLHTSSEYQTVLDILFGGYLYCLLCFEEDGSVILLYLILGHKRERMIIVSALRAKRERMSERLWCARPIERWSARTTPLHSCSTAEAEWYSSFFLIFFIIIIIYSIYYIFFLFLSWGVFISFFRLLLSVKNFVFFLSLLSLLRRSILFGWVASVTYFYSSPYDDESV